MRIAACVLVSIWATACDGRPALQGEVAPLDIVAADGVSGGLTQVGFLSDLGEGCVEVVAALPDE